MTIDQPQPPGKPSTGRRLLGALVVYAGVPYLAVLILMTVFQRSLIYGPDRNATLNDHPATIPGARTEAISLKAADNTQLNGWHIVADGEGGRDDAVRHWFSERPVILYFCGNAGNRAYRAEVFGFLVELGAEVICFDYRGFGDNAGSPSETAFAADAQAIWQFVTTERHIDPRRIVVFGESLGGGVATRLAADLSAAGTPPAGLVLRSTFTRLTDVAAWHHPWLPVRWLMLDRYPSVDRIGAVTCPILILHGRRDTIIPFAEAEQLFAAAREKSSTGIPRHLVALETADHNDVLSAERAAFRSGMKDFLQQLFADELNEQVQREGGSSMLADLVRKLTYFPDRADDLSPQLWRLAADRVQAVSLNTDDGLTLNGWQFLAAGVDATAGPNAGPGERIPEPAARRPVVLFFSGNGGHRGYRVAEAGLLTRAGADVLLFDYRGYGDNPGEPSEEGLAADARTVWRYATDERAMEPRRIILYGESLGGAVATRLAAESCAAETPPAGLILRSTFSTLADVARHHYPVLPVQMLMVEHYPSTDRIGHVTCPVLMLHGQQDTIVPYLLGRKLFAAAPSAASNGTSKQFVDLPHADHNDVLDTEGELMQSAVTEFIRCVSKN